MEYEFYVNQYKGQAIDKEQWPALCARASEQLAQYKRQYRIVPEETAEAMAVCAMAEVMDFFAQARNGQGGLRYVSVGSVSASGKGVYGQMAISPDAENRELYRCARRYLHIERGCAQC